MTLPATQPHDSSADLHPLIASGNVVVLTGAGCSTESGIPDYRGPGRTGPPRTPILHDAFLRRPEVRQRYWARATLGWARFSAAEPNRAHRAIAALERAGFLAGVITQNVDRLHQRAGSHNVIELHGALAEVHCLDCRALHPRDEVHLRLLEANPSWLGRTTTAAPDGDSELEADLVESFRVVSCRDCGGPLKPNVVFFGGNVAPAIVASSYSLVESASALLVVGSSLQVFSGYRFVRRAHERGLPVAILNQGPTRGDALATLRLDAQAGEVLKMLVDRLGLID